MPTSYAALHHGNSLAEDLKAPSISRAYQCQCGRPVFLGNSECLACHTPLGYVIDHLGVVPLARRDTAWRNDGDLANTGPMGLAGAAGITGLDNAGPLGAAAPEVYTVFNDWHGPQYHRCANFLTGAGCNWMRPAHTDADAPDDQVAFHPRGEVAGYCLSCSVTRTIPDLSVQGGGERWRKLEQAKRRLLSKLLALGLPVVTRHADPVHGLAFDFLSNLPGGPRVLTGHEDGVITLNAEEADDAVRERIRTELHEPYRTLLGHFRHEVGHYYWDVLVSPTQALVPCRQLFGDERADYAEALRLHYENGPPPGWADHFVTGYASAHPWEDWAETWAHYLHMADTADTALSFGVDARNVELASDLFEPQDLWQPEHPDALNFLDFLNGWVRLTNVLNELSRSMGQPDYYPFVLPRAAVGKLQFIHQLVSDQRKPVLHATSASTGTVIAPDDASMASQTQSQGPSTVSAPGLS